MQHHHMRHQSQASRPVYLWGMTAIALTTLLLQPHALASSDSLTEQEVIDQIFLTDTPLPGAEPENHQELIELRDGAIAWLGNYERVRTEVDYLVIEFENGEIPVSVSFKSSGEPEGIAAQCPVTSVPLSQAPVDFQAALAECPDLAR